MCLVSQPKVKDPVMPPEYAQQREPDRTTATAAGERTQDRIRAGTDTILTSGSGVTTSAPTAKKTLLGQ